MQYVPLCIHADEIIPCVIIATPFPVLFLLLPQALQRLDNRMWDRQTTNRSLRLWTLVDQFPADLGDHALDAQHPALKIDTRPTQAQYFATPQAKACSDQNHRLQFRSLARLQQFAGLLRIEKSCYVLDRLWQFDLIRRICCNLSALDRCAQGVVDDRMVSPDGVGRYARFYPAVIKALEISPRKLSKIYPSASKKGAMLVWITPL